MRIERNNFEDFSSHILQDSESGNCIRALVEIRPTLSVGSPLTD